MLGYRAVCKLLWSGLGTSTTPRGLGCPLIELDCGLQAEPLPPQTHIRTFFLSWSLSVERTGKACLGSRLGAGPHPRQDSWVGDSACPPPSRSSGFTRDSGRQQMSLREGWGLECLHLRPSPCSPLPTVTSWDPFPSPSLGPLWWSGARTPDGQCAQVS